MYIRIFLDVIRRGKTDQTKQQLEKSLNKPYKILWNFPFVHVINDNKTVFLNLCLMYKI